MVTKLTTQNFDAEVKQSKIPVLVDLYADWCGPCRMLAPTVEDLSEVYAGKVKVCKLNVDEDFPIAAAYGVQNIPTLLFFKDGELFDKSIGLCTKEELSASLDKML